MSDVTHQWPFDIGNSDQMNTSTKGRASSRQTRIADASQDRRIVKTIDADSADSPAAMTKTRANVAPKHVNKDDWEFMCSRIKRTYVSYQTSTYAIWIFPMILQDDQQKVGDSNHRPNS